MGEKMEIKQLEFSVFCIESVAEKLGLRGSEVYKLLKEQSQLLDQYIIPNYEILHTQSKAYIVDDIIDYMKQEGVLE